MVITDYHMPTDWPTFGGSQQFTLCRTDKLETMNNLSATLLLFAPSLMTHKVVSDS